MKAVITIDPEKKVSEIDDRLYSSFIEHMGRAIYTGLYEPGHPAADEDGLRTDVIKYINDAKVTNIRYPGGNFLSGYNWEDGIGPKEKRPTRPDLAWFAIEPNQFGTDEFMKFCEKSGIKPMMGVNLGTGTPQQAANLVEYCNFPGGTYYSELRKQNGHEEPYDVKLWCLGNEMDGPWQICGLTAYEYARKAHETAKMIKWVDPSVELVACGSSNKEMPTFGEWEKTVLRECYDDIDYLSLHTYIRNDDGDFKSFLAKNIEMDGFIKTVKDICKDIKKEKNSDKKIYLSFDEWNVWYHWQNDKKESPKWIVARPLEEDEYNLADALVVGCMMNTLINNADTVKIACLAQMVNALAALTTVPGGKAYAQTIYYPFMMASVNARGTALKFKAEVPSYSCSINKKVPYLDVSSVLSKDGKTLTLLLVNRSLDEEMKINIKGIKGSVKKHYSMFGDLNAINTAEKAEIKPVKMQITEEIVLPKASWNMIQIKLDK